jgi:phosphatidylinositol alpha-1,6-mannosyltransferase
MRGLNILALVTDAFGGRGGIAQYNRDFLSSLVDDDSVSSIEVLPRQSPGVEAPPAGIRQASPQDSRSLYTIVAIARALARPVDIVFCGHLYMAPLAAIIACFSRAKLIVQLHGIEAWQQPTWLQRVATDRADVVLCVSRYTRMALLRWSVITPERVVVLSNTVGDAFTPGDGLALRTELGLTGKQVILTVGRLDGRQRYKGNDRVIRIIPDLVARGHDIIYVVAGDGDDRARLEALAIEIGVAERVKFLGPIPPKMLVDAYRMADLFVMPSTGEGFGIAFLEAMATGTPALGLSVAGARDALADGELGTMVPEDELAITISSLLIQKKTDRRTLAESVRARFGHRVFDAAARAVLRRMIDLSIPFVV